MTFQKSVMVYDDDVWEAFENAAAAAREELDADDPTRGEILAELARAYTGWSP